MKETYESEEMNKKDSFTKRFVNERITISVVLSHYINDTHEFCFITHEFSFITEVLNLWAPTIFKDPMTFPFVCDLLNKEVSFIFIHIQNVSF